MTPPPATPPPTPPPGEPSTTRPGWGRGDENHVHLPTRERSRQELAVANRGMANEEPAPLASADIGAVRWSAGQMF